MHIIIAGLRATDLVHDAAGLVLKVESEELRESVQVYIHRLYGDATHGLRITACEKSEDRERERGERDRRKRQRRERNEMKKLQW